MIAAVVIFIVTYLMIAGRGLSMLPIGRPAGALVGAVAMVVLGVVDPAHGLSAREALAAIELNTVGLLFGMMILASSVHEARLFSRAAAWVDQRHLSGAQLLWVVTLASGVLSALLLNDSVCLLCAPVVDRIARQRGRPRVPFLLALAMGSNAGSAMSLAGNPQNMLVAQLGGLEYRTYLARAGLAGLVGLLATAATLHFLMRKELDAEVPPSSSPPSTAGNATTASERPTSTAVCLIVLAGVSIAFVAGANLAWTAVGGAAAVITLRRKDASSLFDGVSWTVLVFFGALFVVVAGLDKAGASRALLAPLTAAMPTEGPLALPALAATLLIGCQLLSNVPFILLVRPLVEAFPDPQLAWTTVALVTTLAGNMTLLGSVANILVVEAAGAQKEIGFWRYARVGIPATLVATTLSLATLLAVHAALG